jgi:hypothetical protein
MRKISNRLAVGVALFATLAACGTDGESAEDLESQRLADSVAVQEARSAPATSGRTAPAPAASERAATAQPVRAIAAGTLLTFEVRENVSTSSHDAGDTFSLVLVDAVTGPAGAILSAGAPARGLVTEAHSSTGSNDQSLLGLRVASVEAGGSQRQISGEAQSADIETSTRDSGARTAATIATGTAAGAIIGQVLGRDTRSTVSGAAVGTAIGVGVALTTRDGHATLPSGSRIVVRLNEDLVF